MKRTFFKCLITGRPYYRSIQITQLNPKSDTYYQIVFALHEPYKWYFNLDIDFREPVIAVRVFWFEMKFEKYLDLPF